MREAAEQRGELEDRIAKTAATEQHEENRIKRNEDSLMEKAMAPHSSTLACKIPWVEELGGLQSMELLRVRQDWVTSLSLFTLMHWRRKWQPTPVFLPGESQGQGSLVGCRLWGCTESDTAKVTQQQQDSFRDLWENIKWPNSWIIGVPEEEDKMKRYEKIFEKIIVKSFPKMGKEIATQVQED